MQGLPLITFNSRAFALFPLNHYPTISIDNELDGNSSSAFLYNNVQITVDNVRVMSTSCCGIHCDRQRVADWNTAGRGCGCFNNMSRHYNPAIIMTVYFKSSDGQTRIMNEFLSRQFLSFCTIDKIPMDVRASQLQATNAAYDLQDSIIEVTNYINEIGGWTVIGWCRKGIINDQSLVGMTEDGEHAQVDSGNLNFHIVSLIPTNHSFLDK